MARSGELSTRGDDLKYLGYDYGPGARNPDWWGNRAYGPIFDMIDNNPPQGVSKTPTGTHEMKYQLDQDSLGDDNPDDIHDMNDDSLDPDDEYLFAGRELAMNRMRPPNVSHTDTMTDEDPMEPGIPPYYGTMDRAAGRVMPGQGVDNNEYQPWMAQPQPHEFQYEDVGGSQDDVIMRELQGQQAQRPGMKTEQDYQRQFGAPSGPVDPRADPGPQGGMPPSPDQLREHDEAGQMSDEDLLAQVQKGMNEPSITGDRDKDYKMLETMQPGSKEYFEWKDTLDDFYADDSEMQDPRAGPLGTQNLPPTVEEFIKKFGREPATDSEVEYYFGSDQQDDERDLMKR